MEILQISSHNHSQYPYKVAAHLSLSLADFESARSVANILVITQAIVLCLIYMHSPSGVVHIYQAKDSCLYYNLYVSFKGLKKL